MRRVSPGAWRSVLVCLFAAWGGGKVAAQSPTRTMTARTMTARTNAARPAAVAAPRRVTSAARNVASARGAISARQGAAVAPPASGALQVTPQGAPQVAVEADADLVNELLSLLSEVVITRLDGEVSLQSLRVEKGRIVLDGLLLRNLDIGVRLNAGSARRLASVIEKRVPSAASPPGAAPSPLRRVLQIAKLGLFNRIEVSLRLRELRVRRLRLRLDNFDVRDLLLQVGATPNDPATGRLRGDTLQKVLDVLRRSALSRVKVHAGLGALTARRISLYAEGAALEGFGVGLVLARDDDDNQARPASAALAPAALAPAALAPAALALAPAAATPMPAAAMSPGARRRVAP